MENNCYEKIVRDSLQYVACIDDDFVEAYERSGDEKCTEFTKEIYKAIEQTCGCHVEMLRYYQDIEQNRVAKCLSNKDLLILDWELVGENFMPTLKILVEAGKMKIPFVCIYTNRPDVEIICQVIQSYFSGYSASEIEEYCDKWLEAGIMETDFKHDVLELFSVEKPDLRKIIHHVKEMYGEDTQDLDALEYKKAKSWYPLWLKWTNAILPEEALPCASKPRNGTMVIDGMIVCCLSKPTSGKAEAVNIEELIPTIATQIKNVPNSIFNIVWLHYSNVLRDVLQSRSQLFSGIDDRALGYFSKELLAQGECFYDEWMKGLFRDEIMDRLDGKDVGLPREILENINSQYGTVNPGNLATELVDLNEKIMVNHIYSNLTHKIDFGDVFVTVSGEENIESYWMCVTPKCECLRSEDKIENNYLFIKGDRIEKPTTALADAESNYRCFIKKGKDTISINWKTKLISVYFREGQNSVEGIGADIKGIFSGQELAYTYLCNVKENYAQRMANASFAEGNKVGITLAQIKKEKARA